MERFIRGHVTSFPLVWFLDRIKVWPGRRLPLGQLFRQFIEMQFHPEFLLQQFEQRQNLLPQARNCGRTISGRRSRSHSSA